MGRDAGMTRTVETVLADYREACRLSKDDGLSPKARTKVNWALYSEAVMLGADPDALDAATRGGEVKYDFTSEAVVIDALAVIQKRASAALGKDWAESATEKEMAEGAWRAALAIYQTATKVESLAFAKVIGKVKVTLPGKGKDGADLDVPFKLNISDDGKVKAVTGGRGASNSQGVASPLTDGDYHRTKGSTTARMTVSDKGTVFTVSEPIKGAFKSATTAAVKVSPALGYKSHSHNGLRFWKPGKGA